MTMNRRNFLQSAGTLLAMTPASSGQETAPVDFRYAPLHGQTAFCFPDDRFKSLAGERGDLRYGYRRGGLENFNLTVSFSLGGMEDDRISRQYLEAPGVPILHTRLDRPEAFTELTTFATNHPREGRVDNVILEVRPRSAPAIHAIAELVILGSGEIKAERADGTTVVSGHPEAGSVVMVTRTPLSRRGITGGYEFRCGDQRATPAQPSRYFFRFPQEGQSTGALADGLSRPDALLAEAREYWRGWSPIQEPVEWSAAGVYGDFLTGCARNILQARENRAGRLTFQVGPTVYRGLWVVDGHFLLEAGRYMGHDREAAEGLETTWSRQREDGGIFAGAGDAHWKDTGIAMFSLVRQAELSQNWSYFREMQPNVLRGVEFLKGLREKARAEGSANGRYGLLARGMADGGLGGVRSEFTTTLWVLAGLRATLEAAGRLGMKGFENTRLFHDELRHAFFAAAKAETRRHPAGFDYLPMLMAEDQQWSEPDEWRRPRPQAAQWALSHAVYPGLVFQPDDPIVRGHIALMQDCTQEDIPAETGWLPHEGLWNYNAAFVAHVYLWAGLPGWAHRTFHGFLNHATPQYCWREEQPIQGSCVPGYVGDMPHNWASAECVLYLRHMMALESGGSLRLLAGIGAEEMRSGEPWRLSGTPTRFGRVDLNLEPSNRGRRWTLEFGRANGPQPESVRLPAALTDKLHLKSVDGTAFRRSGDNVEITPESNRWTATWADA